MKLLSLVGHKRPRQVAKGKGRHRLGRFLKLESLEQRELLSVSPLSSLQSAVQAANSSSNNTSMANYFLVKSGSIATDTLGGEVADVNQIQGNHTRGQTFNNNVSNTAALLGGTVVSVGSNIIDTYQMVDGTAIPAEFTPAGGTPGALVAVYAVRGNTTAGTTPTFTATQGRIALFAIPDATAYNPSDPLTWGAVDATTGALNQPVATWDLKAPERVVDPGNNASTSANTITDPLGGGPGFFNIPANVVNSVTVDLGNPAEAATGRFLFKESTALDPILGKDYATVTGLADPNTGSVTPTKTRLKDEGLVTTTSERVIVNPDTTGVSTTAGLAALNTIADAFGLPDVPGGTAGQAFATAFGPATTTTNAASTYNPTNTDPANPAASADIQTTLGTTSGIGEQFKEKKEVKHCCCCCCCCCFGHGGMKDMRDNWRDNWNDNGMDATEETLATDDAQDLVDVDVSDPGEALLTEEYVSAAVTTAPETTVSNVQAVDQALLDATTGTSKTAAATAVSNAAAATPAATATVTQQPTTSPTVTTATVAAAPRTWRGMASIRA